MLTEKHAKKNWQSMWLLYVYCSKIHASSFYFTLHWIELKWYTRMIFTALSDKITFRVIFLFEDFFLKNDACIEVSSFWNTGKKKWRTFSTRVFGKRKEKNLGLSGAAEKEGQLKEAIIIRSIWGGIQSALGKGKEKVRGFYSRKQWKKKMESFWPKKLSRWRNLNSI